MSCRCAVQSDRIIAYGIDHLIDADGDSGGVCRIVSAKEWHGLHFFVGTSLQRYGDYCGMY